jgi:anti-anti-sigma regulatory factor
MLTTAEGWVLDVERGPGWLIVTLGSPDPDDPSIPSLADQVWSLAERHFTYRLVVRLDEIRALDRNLLRELVLLYRRIRHHGGLMRLCGLTARHREALAENRLSDRLPSYDDLQEAVMGDGRKPR